MTINRRKLAAVAVAPIFVALATVGDQWRLVEKLPDAYDAGRWTYSDRQYAEALGTTIEAYRQDEYDSCLARRDACLAAKSAEQAMLNCSCDFRAILKFPDDDLATHFAGAMGAAASLIPLALNLLLSVAISWSVIVLIPPMITRLWRWLHV